MNFTLKRPCKDCPFLIRNSFLTPARAYGIAHGVLNDDPFWCHKTLDYDTEDEDEGGDGTGVFVKGSQHCAGATIMCEHNHRPNQAMRIAERLGLYDPTKLDMESEVYKTPEEMREGHKKHLQPKRN